MTEMEKMNIKRFLVMLLVISFTGALKAQSMRWAETNQVFIQKIGDNHYANEPVGIVTFKFENNKFWEIWEGVPHLSKELRGSLSRKEDKTYYYNRNNVMVGYYEPATNRYTLVSALEDGSIGKEDEFALLFEGDLYMGFGEIKYKVDESFPPEVVGFFIFLH